MFRRARACVSWARASLKSVQRVLGQIRGTGVGFVLLIVMLVLLGAFGVSDSSYGKVEAGPVVRLSGAVTGSAVDATEASTQRVGWFAMTTVQARTLSWGEVIVETVLRHEVSPIDAQQRAVVGAQMDASKHLAAAVALEIVGYTYESDPGAYVAAVAPGSPAAAAGLLPGTVIVSVDGKPVTTPADVATAIRANASVALTVRTNPMMDRSTQVVRVYPVEGRIGVDLLPASAVALSTALDLATVGVGGPSAGLMMTLAYLDALLPGDLTAGRAVAGTGTMSTQRTVGPVAGATLKVQAAIQAEMDVFFVPKAHGTEVRAVAQGRITVVEVETLADAVEYLCGLGADDAVCNNGG